MKLTKDEIEILKFFCFKLLNDYNDSVYNMPFIRFIFNDFDYLNIVAYLEDLKHQKKDICIDIKANLQDKNISFNEIEKTIQLIKNQRNEFIENYDENITYIKIPNSKEFFRLLNELMVCFDNGSRFNNFNATELLRSVWLRMSPSDINDVNNFLKRQIKFVKNDYLMPTAETVLEQIDDLYISYLNHGNEGWFETNRHIKLFIKRKVGEVLDDWLGSKDIFEYYTLPVIHCGFIKENAEPTCYIYGIQNFENNVKDEVINLRIHEEKKRIRNKYVSPDFIIALKIFLDILKEKGITTIKVPLLQTFNYEFHQKLGETYANQMAEYSIEKINSLDKMDSSSHEVEKYQNIKELYERYFNKEDLISANKTERLINTFYLVSGMYNSIEIITEPFIESDNLICKIKCRKEKKTL